MNKENTSKYIKARSTVCLLITSMIWGAAFVAQSVSMDYIEPLTFICLRSLIGTLVLFPVILLFDRLAEKKEPVAGPAEGRKLQVGKAGLADIGEVQVDRDCMTESRGPQGDKAGPAESRKLQGDKAGLKESRETQGDKAGLKEGRGQAGSRVFREGGWQDPVLWKAGIICGLFLFLANCAQQTGIQYTTAGKAGFITAFYIILVPVAGLFFHRRCGLLTWIGVGLALVGLYFLCITGDFSMEKGDGLLLLCAFLYTGQIMSIDRYNWRVDAMKLSMIQFLMGSILGGIGMFLFEEPHIPAILDAAGPILYTGVMSTGVAYTLQIIGQKGLNPTLASLLMSLEAVFSVLAGYLFLHEVLSAREMLGCVIMFAAIVLAQLGDGKQEGKK